MSPGISTDKPLSTTTSLCEKDQIFHECKYLFNSCYDICHAARDFVLGSSWKTETVCEDTCEPGCIDKDTDLETFVPEKYCTKNYVCQSLEHSYCVSKMDCSCKVPSTGQVLAPAQEIQISKDTTCTCFNNELICETVTESGTVVTTSATGIGSLDEEEILTELPKTVINDDEQTEIFTEIVSTTGTISVKTPVPSASTTESSNDQENTSIVTDKPVNNISTTDLPIKTVVVTTASTSASPSAGTSTPINTVITIEDETSNSPKATIISTTGSVVHTNVATTIEGGSDVSITPPVVTENPCYLWSDWSSSNYAIFDDHEPINSVKNFVCETNRYVEIRCRSFITKADYKLTGQDVTCDLENGLICNPTNGVPCYDYEIQVACLKPSCVTPVEGGDSTVTTSPIITENTVVTSSLSPVNEENSPIIITAVDSTTGQSVVISTTETAVETMVITVTGTPITTAENSSSVGNTEITETVVVTGPVSIVNEDEDSDTTATEKIEIGTDAPETMIVTGPISITDPTSGEITNIGTDGSNTMIVTGPASIMTIIDPETGTSVLSPELTSIITTGQPDFEENDPSETETIISTATDSVIPVTTSGPSDNVCKLNEAAFVDAHQDVKLAWAKQCESPSTGCHFQGQNCLCPEEICEPFVDKEQSPTENVGTDSLSLDDADDENQETSPVVTDQPIVTAVPTLQSCVNGYKANQIYNKQETCETCRCQPSGNTICAPMSCGDKICSLGSKFVEPAEDSTECCGACQPVTCSQFGKAYNYGDLIMGKLGCGSHCDQNVNTLEAEIVRDFSQCNGATPPQAAVSPPSDEDEDKGEEENNTPGIGTNAPSTVVIDDESETETETDGGTPGIGTNAPTFVDTMTTILTAVTDAITDTVVGTNSPIESDIMPLRSKIFLLFLGFCRLIFFTR